MELEGLIRPTKKYSCPSHWEKWFSTSLELTRVGDRLTYATSIVERQQDVPGMAPGRCDQEYDNDVDEMDKVYDQHNLLEYLEPSGQDGVEEISEV
jgi:hypothetical protein